MTDWLDDGATFRSREYWRSAARSFAVSLDHEHAFSLLRTITLPATDGGHTFFEVLVCPCGVYDVFPINHFARAEAELRAEFAREMSALGFRRVAP